MPGHNHNTYTRNYIFALMAIHIINNPEHDSGDTITNDFTHLLEEDSSVRIAFYEAIQFVNEGIPNSPHFNSENLGRLFPEQSDEFPLLWDYILTNIIEHGGEIPCYDPSARVCNEPGFEDEDEPLCEGDPIELKKITVNQFGGLGEKAMYFDHILQPEDARDIINHIENKLDLQESIDPTEITRLTVKQAVDYISIAAGNDATYLDCLGAVLSSTASKQSRTR